MTCQEEFVKLLDEAINADKTPYIEYGWLKENAHSISKPPKLTTIRINTLKNDVAKAREVAQQILTAQNSGFIVDQHKEFNDLLLINPLGPFVVEPAHRRALVSVECAQAVLRGSPVFAPGVLAVNDAPAASETCNLVSVWADLEGRCTRGLRKSYTGRTCFIGNGQLVQSRDQIFNQNMNPPRGIAILMSELHWRMPSFDDFPKGWFYPQNFPSFLAVEELDICPGMTILDMCASPGGKTSHIAAKMKNKGVLLALDKNVSKVTRLKQNLKELSVTCAKVYVGDSTRIFPTEDGVQPEELGDELVPLAPSSFDRILLDPPCSGLGQRPKLLAPEPGQISNPSISAYQRKLLQCAASLLRPGGILVYSTCTLTLAENEENIVYAVKELSFNLLEADQRFGSPGIPVRKQGEAKPEIDASKVRRFWPSGAEDTIGFFFAKLSKEGLCSRDPVLY